MPCPLSSPRRGLGRDMGNDQDGIQRLKQHVFNHFQTKDLGKLKYFLGIKIAQSKSCCRKSSSKFFFGNQGGPMATKDSTNEGGLVEVRYHH